MVVLSTLIGLPAHKFLSKLATSGSLEHVSSIANKSLKVIKDLLDSPQGAQIKAKMLLPRPILNEEGEEID